MNHLVIALIVFGCVFGSSLVGMWARAILPPHHLSDQSINVVKMATGLIATMARCLVLGLLVSSAKGTFDTTSAELVQNSRQRHPPRSRTGQVWAGNAGRSGACLRVSTLKRSRSSGPETRHWWAELGDAEAVAKLEDFQRTLEALAPRDDQQRQLKAQALQILDTAFAARWLALLQMKSTIPVSLLIVLVLWLSIVFGTFGMFADRNGTIIAALMLCALSTSGAIFLIEEMSTPLNGMVTVSLAPMRDALAHLGQ
ncbi:bestrophin-like domain [Cupriavidus basilensis]